MGFRFFGDADDIFIPPKPPKPLKRLKPCDMMEIASFVSETRLTLEMLSEGVEIPKETIQAINAKGIGIVELLKTIDI